MATEEKSKKSKKKVVITVVVVIAVVLIVVALVSFLFMRGGMGGGGGDDSTTSVSSVTAELGDVSTTITGSGTLAAGTTTDVTMPSGLSVDEVYVEEGDSVEEGDALATVNLASIAQALLDARESLSTVEEQIANLSDTVSDTTSDEYLESIILYDEQESLTEEVEALEALLADPTITATASGTIGSVNVSTDSSSSTSSSTSSTGSTSSTESTDSSALASLLSGSTTTATDSTDASSTTSTSTSLSSTGLSLTTAFTIVSDEDATITLSIDEADILSVEVGQTAVVEVDSIEDETFEGTVTEVSTSSSSTSGSVKYTAVITIERTDEMLLGMSASATITIDEATDAVLIPVSALQESGSTTFVYTEVDEDGNLGGEVEVETGLSDGDEVEILSGLSEGDVVYYTRTSSDNSGLGGLLSALGGGQGGGEGGEGESGGPDAE